MRVHEFIPEGSGEPEVLKLKSPDTQHAQQWIDRVYAAYPYTFNGNHVMSWGTGDEQVIALFKLRARGSLRHLIGKGGNDAVVEIDWFQAVPQRSKVGTRAMLELQNLASEDGITLTLVPWARGKSRSCLAGLKKFYGELGFKSLSAGRGLQNSGTMYWEPNSRDGSQDQQGVTEGYSNTTFNIQRRKLNVPADTGENLTEELNVDVPNEKWLEDAINYAKTRPRNSYGVPYMGKITAWVNRVLVPVDKLKYLPGMRDEQNNVRQHDLDAIVKIMQDTGKLPLTRSGSEYEPFINVAYNGEAWVSEGNHRIMAAAKLGWKYLPVHITYFDGGERIKTGQMYPGHIGLGSPALEEGWRGAAATAAAALGLLGSTPKIDTPVQKPPSPVLREPAGMLARMAPIEKTLMYTAKNQGIKGSELAQLLAQCAHETAGFSKMEEQGSTRYLTRKYDPKYSPSIARKLGNIKPGDGVRYKGRGLVQLTGRDNYARAGRALNLPLLDQPELASDPKNAIAIAMWYWNNRVKPRVDDFNDTATVTRTINPGLKGLDDRHAKFVNYSRNLYDVAK